MKQMNSNGNAVRIIGSPRRPKSSPRHDQWLSPAPSDLEFVIRQAKSGTWFLMLEGNLLDGQNYDWPFASGPDIGTVSALLGRIIYENFPGLGRPATGEWWNYNFRDDTIDKFLSSDASPFFDSH